MSAHGGDEGAPRLTHVDDRGQARMVDVSAKAVTVRRATARGRVLLSPEAVEALRGGAVPKGDALAGARVAGVQAAQRTPGPGPPAPPVGRAGGSGGRAGAGA